LLHNFEDFILIKHFLIARNKTIDGREFDNEGFFVSSDLKTPCLEPTPTLTHPQRSSTVIQKETYNKGEVVDNQDQQTVFSG